MYNDQAYWNDRYNQAEAQYERYRNAFGDTPELQSAWNNINQAWPDRSAPPPEDISQSFSAFSYFFQSAQYNTKEDVGDKVVNSVLQGESVQLSEEDLQQAVSEQDVEQRERNVQDLENEKDPVVGGNILILATVAVIGALAVLGGAPLGATIAVGLIVALFAIAAYTYKAMQNNSMIDDQIKDMETSAFGEGHGLQNDFALNYSAEEAPLMSSDMNAGYESFDSSDIYSERPSGSQAAEYGTSNPYDSGQYDQGQYGGDFSAQGDYGAGADNNYAPEYPADAYPDDSEYQQQHGMGDDGYDNYDSGAPSPSPGNSGGGR